MKLGLSFWLPAGLLTAVAAVLCFVPLFNLLAYEFCLGLGLVAAPASAAIGLGAAKCDSPRWERSVGLALLALTPALVLISLNAIRVQNCDYVEGLWFFLALPVATSVYGSALGHAVVLLTPRFRGLWLAALLLWPLAARLLALYTEPQIFVFDHLWGHFAGSLYDETITLDARVLWWRGGTALRVAVLVGLTALALRTGQRAVALVAFLFVGWVYDEVAGSAGGYRLDRRDTEYHLSIVVERPGLQVHFPGDTAPEAAERMADYHQYWVARLKKTLGVDGPELIRSYVYQDRDQKARLMGGRGTMVAKPWLGEIHVHGLQVPHNVVPHELVHVLAAEYGSPPFGVTAHLGVLVDMGIVEGLAEAITPSRSDYDHHYWVRALRVLERAPDVRRLVAVTDFWRAPPARAYTVMGSFIRYLIETRGAEPVRLLYRNGDFETALGSELETVVTEWEHFIDGLELSSRERRAAEERFRRRSIFQRTCAHEIAQLRTRASTETPSDAVGTFRQIAGFLRNSPDARYEIALAELRAGNKETFATNADSLLAEGSLNLWRATQLRERLGQLRWENNDLAGAQERFEAALENPSTLDSERLQWVRLWALDLPPESRDFMREFLSGNIDRPVAIDRLSALAEAAPGDPTFPYLLARQLLQKGDDRAALNLLADIQHPFLPIESERIRLIADALERQGENLGAASAYDAVARIMPRSGAAARLRARADWLRWLARSADG
ncbi:MAG: hypothetical protein AAF654_04730 [Myxococcota bacterium]